jgi:hypothetical protein
LIRRGAVLDERIRLVVVIASDEELRTLAA